MGGIRQSDPSADPRDALNAKRTAISAPQLLHWLPTIRDLRGRPSPPGHPAFHRITCSVTTMTGGVLTQTCGAVDVSPDAAIAAAIGEALDRYFAVESPLVESAFLASYDQLRDSAVCPWDLEPEPVSATRLLRESGPRLWVTGFALLTNDSRFAPLEVVLANRGGVHPLNVSGFATARSLEHAARCAAEEVVERDTFLISWATQTSRHVDPASLESPLVEQYLEGYREVGLRPVLRLCSPRDSETAVIAASLPARFPTSGPALGLGSGADAAAAAASALRELAQAHARGRPYRHEEVEAYNRWCDGEGNTDFEGLKLSEAACFDIGPKWLADMGLFVARAVIPGSLRVKVPLRRQTVALAGRVAPSSLETMEDPPFS